MDAATQFSTTTLAARIRSNTHWTSVNALKRKLIELQNRCPASLAMSGDGSFPSRPRHFWPSCISPRSDYVAALICFAGR